jgi:hypothetical protein
MMVLLGAHCLPFVFLYGMRLFAVLAALIVGGGVTIAVYWSDSFSVGAWYTGAILLVFACIGGRSSDAKFQVAPPNREARARVSDPEGHA